MSEHVVGGGVGTGGAGPGETVVASFADLAGRVAVVTGASRGIGAATARALAAQGVSVALVARDGQRLADVAAGVERSLAVPTDCTDADALAAAAARVREEMGPVSLLCAFAGGSGFPVPSVEETPAHWRQVLESDLTSTFLTIRAFLPDLLTTRGVVVTMASSAGRQAGRSNAAYAAAKAGVVSLTRHLGVELAPRGVRVNCVAPSTVENERWATASEEQRRGAASVIPLGRIGQPDDVVSAVLFLASDAAAWITGITLDVAGGFATH
ncbi:SDR family oxidoreductase [Propioniciclava sp.]|uniref:SDR family NAD(P)-dependent oxidoreductase n=1 Tax=Propioniciclava sp. TaxID=2038686 RepID=UPI00261E0CB9|nr:SDR family oxidoreductase [Propioniciclava sp.]